MTQYIIDTHTHLCDSEFDDDRTEVIERAKQSGVVSIIAVGETLEDARKNIRLAKQYPEIHPAAGLYPAYLDIQKAEEIILFIRKHQNDLIAISEVGLDFWIAKTDEEREIQKEIFKKFIELSRELNLPINIHSRSAGKHVISLLLEHNAQKVQLHAFDGKASTALTAVEAGYYFSVPPSIVRSRQKQKLVKQLPLSCLLVETDSPVLGPTPGKRNEPANIVYSVKAIADIKEVKKEKVIETCYNNTIKLYGKFS